MGIWRTPSTTLPKEKWGIFPEFEGDCVTLDAYCMSDEFWNLPGQAYERQMKAASLILYKRITDNPLMQNKYTSEQIEALKKGSKNGWIKRNIRKI